MDTSLKNTETRGSGLFRGAVSWVSFLVLLCIMVSGLFVLLLVALDTQVAGGIWEAAVSLSYGDYPKWLPVTAVSLGLFFGGLFFFCFLRSRRPPGAARFPDTTLVRSSGGGTLRMGGGLRMGGDTENGEG